MSAKIIQLIEEYIINAKKQKVRHVVSPRLINFAWKNKMIRTSLFKMKR